MNLLLLLSLFYYFNTHCATTIFEGNNSVNLISKSDFTSLDSSGYNLTYTINNPGTYKCIESIFSTAENPSDSIIYITSNDVVLDLNKQTIALDSNTPTINGITLNNNVENITIKNGLIRGSINNGIKIGSNVSNIIIENIHIKDCNNAGILITGTSNAFSKNIRIDNCNIRNSDGENNNDAIGLKLNYCQFIQVINSQFILNSNLTTNYSGYGVYAENSAGCGFENCIVSGNSGNSIGAGYYIKNSNGFIFNNCLAGLNVGINSTSESYGFHFENSHFHQLYSCTANNNKAVHLAAGFAFISSSGNKITDCSSNSTQITGSGSTDAAYGFYLSGSQNNNEFTHCSAFGTMSGTHASSYGVGFSLSGTTRCIISNCSANSNGGNVGYGIGIHLQSTCGLCTVENCTTSLNTSSTSGQGYGMKDDSSNKDNLLISNFAFGNRDTTGSPVDKNYVTNYSLTNVVTEVYLASIGSLVLDTKKNVAIKPGSGLL